MKAQKSCYLWFQNRSISRHYKLPTDPLTLPLLYSKNSSFLKQHLTFPAQYSPKFQSLQIFAQHFSTEQSPKLSANAEEYRKNVLNPWWFKWFALFNLPMALLVNMKVIFLDGKKSQVSIPYKYLNKNPFNSLYFACLSMAGELSTGVLVMMATYKSNPPISMLG
jgi:hypothetical protein